jgi:hypothetical protein
MSASKGFFSSASNVQLVTETEEHHASVIFASPQELGLHIWTSPIRSDGARKHGLDNRVDIPSNRSLGLRTIGTKHVKTRECKHNCIGNSTAFQCKGLQAIRLRAASDNILLHATLMLL